MTNEELCNCTCMVTGVSHIHFMSYEKKLK